MNTPDVQKHLSQVMGQLLLELATAKAVIEALEKSLAEAKAEHPDGARGADEPGQGS